MKIKYILILTLLFVLFFIEFPQIFASRSLDRVSDFGHIIIFAIVVNMILKYFYRLKECSKSKQLIYIIFFIIIISVLIESIQYFTHRTPDLADIKRNLLGGLIGFLYASKKSFRRKSTIKILAVILSFFVLFEFYLVVRAVADDTNARLNFPILSDFETSFEIDRWEGRADFKIVDTISRSGKYSLEVVFKKNEFSDVSLIHFPGDWHNYDHLIFSVFNQADNTAILEIRIYDIDYNEANSSEVADRYNQIFEIGHGWNDIIIPVQDMINAPESRKMDMTNLTRIRLFTQFLPLSQRLYFDNFKLE